MAAATEEAELLTRALPAQPEPDGVVEDTSAERDGTVTSKIGPLDDLTRDTETMVLRRVQGVLGSDAAVRSARALSLFGEHAAGWLAIALVGAAVDRKRRREWLLNGAGVALAHGLSIGVKRVVRRPRPDHPEVKVLVGTPSELSFPSSHATSTTAAAVLYGGMLRKPLTPVLVPVMVVSRLVLGVHFPTDVLVGSALGAAVGRCVRAGTRHLTKRPPRTDD